MNNVIEQSDNESLISIANSFTVNKSEDDSKTYKRCADFYRMAASIDIDNELSKQLISLSSEINDAVIPLFQFVFEGNYDINWYSVLVDLDDGSINLIECETLLKRVISNDVSYKAVRKAMNMSSSQMEFEKTILSYIEDNEQYSATDSIIEQTEYSKPLEENLTDLVHENSDYKAMICLLQSKEKEHTRQIINLQKDLKHREECISTVKNNYNQVSTKLNILEKKLEKAYQMNTFLKAHYETSIKEKQRFVMDISEYQKDINAYNTRINEMSSVIEELNGEIEGLRNSMTYEKKTDTVQEEFEPGFESLLNDEDVKSDFMTSLMEDDNSYYNEEDVVKIQDKRSVIEKGATFFLKIMSEHFEKKFEKKSQSEQNNLIFIKLMENRYSKDVMVFVKKVIESDTSISRLELYKLIINKCSENEIRALCNNAA